MKLKLTSKPKKQEVSEKRDGVFNFADAPPSIYSVMVIDIGSMFVKYSMFMCNNGMEKYLVKSEIKFAEELYSDGVLNYNLLGRDIARKVEQFSEIHKIDLLVCVPPKIMTNPITIPKMEYQEKSVEYKKQIKEEYKQSSPSKTAVYDWLKTEDNSLEDYQSVIIDYIDETIVYHLSDILVKQKVKNFIVTSPVTQLLGLFNDDKPHLVIDFGNTTIRLAIVQKGNLMVVRDFSKAGQFITTTFTGPNEPVTLQHIMEKHSLTLEEYPLKASEVFHELQDTIEDMVKSFGKISDEKIVDYTVIGGSASLEIEKELDEVNIGIKRVYTKLDLDNDNTIPTEARNYLMPSYSSFNFLIHNINDTERFIDFSASKSGGIGLKVKTISQGFKKNKAYFIGGLASLYALLGIGIYSSKMVYDYNLEVTDMHSSYEGELNSLTENKNGLTTKYNELLSQDVDVELFDTGKLLHKVRSIAPPNFNIKAINLEGQGDTGTIVVSSQSQVIVATFLTLLQDPSGGAFDKANIVKVDIEESLGKSIYVTTIFVEGRKL